MSGCYNKVTKKHPPKLPFFIKEMSPETSKFAIYTYLYCPPKLLFFIKECPPKLHNLLYTLTCIVPLNYPFSLKNAP